MRVLEPDTLTVITTNRCTAACRHCSIGSGPDRTEALDEVTLLALLDDFIAETDLRIVAFAGGEPLLLGDALLAAIARCRERGVRTRVITNGYWATSPEAARAVVSRLRAAGLDELNLSTDDYHLPYVPIARVRTAFEAARDAGFDAVAVLNTCGPESWLTPERLHAALGAGGLALRWGDHGERAPDDAAPAATHLILSNRRVLRLGRGLHGLAPTEVDPAEDLEAMAAELGGCPWAIRSAALTPKGHFVACCSFELDDNEVLDYGDATEESAATLLDRADGDLVTNMIALIGPPQIRALLERLAPGETVWPRPQYTGYCDVCEDLVGIPENRRALYRHQGAFADAILALRDHLRAGFTDPDGRVRLPRGGNLAARFSLQTEP